MLNCVGDEKMQVVAFLLRKKDTFNGINATMKEIAKGAGVSINTVSRTMKTLQDNDYLHKVRNGMWRLSPRIVCNGKHSIGMATINYYDHVD